VDRDYQEFKEEVETTDMALFVRTSDEAMYGWDRQKIVDALIRETYVDFDTAKEVAREVEDLIATSKIKMITAPSSANSWTPNWSKGALNRPERCIPA
jgi:ribonucleoside-triphosphate reductase